MKKKLMIKKLKPVKKKKIDNSLIIKLIIKIKFFTYI